MFIVSNFCHPLFLSLTHIRLSSLLFHQDCSCEGCLIVKSNGSFSTRILNYQQHLLQRCSLSSMIISLFLFSKVLCSLAFPPTSQINVFISFARPSSSPQTGNDVVCQDSVLSHFILSIHAHPLCELPWSHGFKCHAYTTNGPVFISSPISPLNPRPL